MRQEMLCSRSDLPRSAEGCGAELVERELSRRFPAALRAVLDMTPRPEQPRALRVEHHDERLGVRIELEAEVGPPGRRRIPGVEVEPFQNAAKTHPGRVEKPRAVARLEDEWHIGGRLHPAILPEGSDKSTTGRLRFDDVL